MRDTVLDAKKALVTEIKDKFTKSASSVVVEYRGLSVAEVTELRRQLRAENVEFKVYKNSLTSRAAEAAGFNELSEQLTGPNAIAFSDDAVAPSRGFLKSTLFPSPGTSHAFRQLVNHPVEVFSVVLD